MKEMKIKVLLVLVMNCIAAILLIGLFSMNYSQDTHVSALEEKSIKKGDVASVQYEIKEKDTTDSKEFNGYFVEKGKQYKYYIWSADLKGKSTYNKYYLALKKDGKYYMIPTKLYVDEKVDEKIGDGIKYNYSSFNATISKNELKSFKKKDLYMIVYHPDKSVYVYNLGEKIS